MLALHEGVINCSVGLCHKRKKKIKNQLKEPEFFNKFLGNYEELFKRCRMCALQSVRWIYGDMS